MGGGGGKGKVVGVIGGVIGRRYKWEQQGMNHFIKCNRKGVKSLIAKTQFVAIVSDVTQ